MIPRRRVSWTRSAALDLRATVLLIARTSPQNAQKVLQQIRTVADTLESFPDRGRAVPEVELLGLTSQREVLTSPYRTVYRSDQETVVVMAVFGGRRDRHDVLAERLLRAASGPA